MNGVTVHVVRDAETLASDVAARLTELVTDCTVNSVTPRIVLTGGTIAEQIYRRLDAGGADWSTVHWYWGDERFVPDGHDDRNDRQAREAFLDRIGASADHVHAMPAHGCDLSMAQAADAYAAELPAEPFDLVLLGVGPDGHVASLFPHHDTLHVMDRSVVEEFDSPKPPSQRLTLTFAALNHTVRTWFLVSGEAKAEAVARALAPEGAVEQTPARGAHGTEETLWLLDDAAASEV